MTDIIKQLPDRLANQIAAGEVIQRPGSVVKELIENAVDAGATEITLIIKDAGKELIQVIDNGKGMSPMDARMCFERHATSKIQDIQDLFTIRTMGFRGEAMASIAAVAQVELIAATRDSQVGTKIRIEGGQFMQQENTGSVVGTNISVKNLFFNVPARRKFLKSNHAEMRHITDEFVRVAMAHPDIVFKFYNNDTEQMFLRKGSLKTRVVDILGNKFERILVNLEEDTDYLKVHGFIGRPEDAGRTKNNQFFFINNRFIKSPYLNHAIASAYESLIPDDEHPVYVLFLEMDPTKVDVNVHPTKQEVKFEDERTIYSYLKSIVTNVLARFNLAPPLDFTLSPEIQKLESLHTPESQIDVDAVAKGYLSSTFSKANSAHFIERNNQRKDWEQARNTFFDQVDIIQSASNHQQPEHKTEFIQFPDEEINEQPGKQILFWSEYLITAGKSGIFFVHIQRAQERIVYDQLLHRYLYGQSTSQKLLFPEMVDLSLKEISYLEEIDEELKKIGFEISSMGKNTVAIHSVPPELIHADIRGALEDIIEDGRFAGEYQKPIKDIEKVLRIASKKASGKYQPTPETNQALIGELFSCAQPEYAPSGGKIIFRLQSNDINELFKQ